LIKTGKKYYLLVDAICSSATFGFAWTFQYNQLGTIVGEPTGGTKMGLNGGEMFFLTLPNSKIEIDVPLIYYYTKNVPDEGVKPDVLIKTNQKNIVLAQDASMDYVMKFVSEKSK
jgi:C-terminal processing protease CtpA/Prc